MVLSKRCSLQRVLSPQAIVAFENGSESAKKGQFLRKHQFPIPRRQIRVSPWDTGAGGVIVPQPYEFGESDECRIDLRPISPRSYTTHEKGSPKSQGSRSTRMMLL